MPNRCKYLDTDGERCKKRALYGTESKCEFCKEHKGINMTYNNGRKCKCGRVARYGTHGKQPVCCSFCKTEEMIDRVTRKCKCGKIASFGKNNKATHCIECKDKNMKNVRSKKCKCGSGKIISFGFPSKRRVCCGSCKKEGMICMNTRKCKCGTSAYFGYPTDPLPTNCGSCKDSEMVNIKTKKCKCGRKSPNFGFVTDKTPSCCFDCKDPKMINLLSKKCKCGTYACFGYSDGHRTHCAICKESDMENIADLSKRCRSNEQGIPCTTTGNKQYNGFCTHCFANLFPDNPKTSLIRTKSKELRVVNFISQHFDGFVHDKPLYAGLNGGCCNSKRRIDLRRLINGTLLCIEVDEKQHRGYCKTDATNRYDNLFISGKYIFIRYNPDTYKDQDGKRKNPRELNRQGILLEEIKRHIKRIENYQNTELVEIYHLFYDQ